jgi:mitogen-activated protein kinase kinase kinase
MEYMSQGSLAQNLDQFGSLDEAQIKKISKQVLLGLNFLHSNQIIHKDLKCSNILLSHSQIKLCDFGCALLIEKTLS